MKDSALMRLLEFASLAVVSAVLACPRPCFCADNPLQPATSLIQKRLIEWGWDEPDTRFIRDNIAAMEQLPFDGLVFHVTSTKGGNLTWELWGGRAFDIDEFRPALDDLAATRFTRLTDRFLRVNVTPGTTDWFDDGEWKRVLANFAVAAQVAKRGGCKGFMFDVERYQGQLFDFRAQKRPNTATFVDFQAQVRRRGAEWMREVNRHFPDITILLTFGYAAAQPKDGSGSRAGVADGLLSDFLDGILEACSTETQIVDAWEPSYAYKRQQQFDDAYDTIKTRALKWTAQPERYRRHVQAGFGVWMDNDWRKFGWDTSDTAKNYFAPVEFEAAVHSALRRTDRYVWIYTEQPRWWTREKLPQAYIDALLNARNQN
jgi:hypothetical protein